MKRILTIIIILLALFTTSCSSSGKDTGETLGDKRYNEKPTQEDTQNKINAVWQKDISDSELDNLVKSFVVPPTSIDNLNLNETYPGLPIELINKFKKAVYKGNSDSLIHELNDKSLMITVKDFAFKPSHSDDIFVKKLNKIVKNGAKKYLVYKCDINGDGTDEIVMMQNLKYEDSELNGVYILKKTGDKYVFDEYGSIGYNRCFAIFKYNGKFYLAANYDDSKTKTTKAVGLYAFDDDKSDSRGALNVYTYIKKSKLSDNNQYNLLYKNINFPIVSDLEKYIKDIGTDLIYCDRIHHTFYGNETERKDLLEEEIKKNSKLPFWNLNTVDVNNDGKDEFFNREINDGDDNTNETMINWYNPKTSLRYPAPFTAWSSTEYFLTQQWFKIINHKTVIFTLYHKNSDDTYVLDARINENGQTTILMDYIIYLNTSIELPENFDGDETNFVAIDYNDSDVEKAFPEDIEKRTKSLSTKVQGDFVAVDYKHKDIPNSLIILAEKALFNEKIDQLNMGTASFEISVDSFYDKYGQYTWYDSKKKFESYISHIYKYKLGNNTFYIAVSDDGGTSKLVTIDLYKELDGKLTILNEWLSLDKNARVIKYQGDLYFIESSYNYYSKYTDTINIYRLFPDKIKDYVSITLKPKKFEWEEVFNNHQSYEKKISSYLDNMKDDLMAKSTIDDNIQVYFGDEEIYYDDDKKLRLKSVRDGYDDDVYYKIDFNNDGEFEYFEREYWFPSNSTTLNLIYNFYKFTDKRIIEVSSDFDTNSMLIQLWFKKIEGKVFAFRLFLNEEYNYFLNVSLVDNKNITQVQSYLIVPKKEFNISNKECNNDLIENK